MTQQGDHNPTALDHLTGLYALQGFIDEVSREAASQKRPFTIIYVNVPHFKEFNRTYGFVAGDEFLYGIGNLLSQNYPTALICRENADHFFLCIEDMSRDLIQDRFTGLHDAVHMLERGIHMHLRAGACTAYLTKENLASILDNAETACDYAVETSSRSIMYYDEQLERRASFRRYIIAGFAQAIEKGYIRPYYQQQVRTLTGGVCGFEALARWVDPVYGVIQPVDFIAALEDARLISQLDLAIIKSVCKDLRRFIDQGLDVVPVSVNVSRIDFMSCNMFEEVEACRKAENVPPRLLNIEITESAFAKDQEVIFAELDKFREAGYKIWLDDFGSGYSTLGTIQRYRFDTVKLDMGLLHNMESSPQTRRVLFAIIDMCKELGMEALAEGVETDSQHDFFRQIGCQKLQGFLFGRPSGRGDWEEARNKYKVTVDAARGAASGAEKAPVITFEEERLTPYYDDITAVNVIGPVPLRSSREITFDTQPVTLIEVDNGAIRFIYATESYLALLKRIGIADLQDANDHAHRRELIENDIFLDLADRAEQSGSVVSSEVVINNVICTMSLLFLSRTGNRRAFAMQSRVISANSLSLHQRSIDAGIRNVFSAFFRVDIHDSDGTARNIYVAGYQERIADELPGQQDATREYARRYLVEEDRERFCAYYDVDRIEHILRTEGTRVFNNVFRSSLPGEEGRLQEYTIIPFYADGRLQLLSCCRYLDEELCQQIVELSGKTTSAPIARTDADVSKASLERELL